MDTNLTRKESITRTAIEIIDEMGIQGLSIRELAKRQEVTEPAIYRHFDNKQAIVLSVLDFFFHSGINIMEAAEKDNREPKEAIIFFIRSHADFFEQYPAITAVVFSEEIFRDDPVVADRMKEICEGRFRFVNRLIEEGQRRGEIARYFSAEDLADIVLGLKRRMTLKWRMGGYDFPLRDKVISIVEALLNIPDGPAYPIENGQDTSPGIRLRR